MVWNTVGNLVYFAAQWLLTYIVIRVLGYDMAGLLSLAMTIGTSFSGVATYTMRSFQVSDVVEEYSAGTYIASRGFTCAISLVACVAFEVVNGYDPFTFACIFVFMIYKIVEAISDVYQGILQKEMRLDYVGISLIVRGIASLVVFFAVILCTRNLLVALVSIVVMTSLVVVLYDRRKALARVTPNSKHFTRKSVVGVLVACFPLAAYGFLFNATGQAPRYFIELALGSSALGYYTSVALPVAVVQLSASFLFSPLVTPMAVALKEGKRSAFIGMFMKVMGAIGAVAVLAFVVAALLGGPVLTLMFGSSIDEYVYLLLPLVGCAVLTAYSWFLANVLTVLRKLRILIAMSLVSFIVVCASCLPALSVGGMNGATFSLIAALAVFSLGCLGAILKAMRSGVRAHDEQAAPTPTDHLS